MKKYLKLLIFFATIVSVQTYAAPQPFNSTDFSHWLSAAYIADASYKTEADLAKVLQAEGYEETLYEQVEGFDVVYVLATNTKTKQQIIAIRGTANANNAIADAAFVLVPDKMTGINIHQGFLLSARDIYQHVLPAIKREYTINTVGHSLGGADALILAMMLDAQGYKIGEVITFGQPKVTNISGSRKFEHLNIKRLVTQKDIVPLVPPMDPADFMNLSIFWHQGTEIVLLDENQYSVLTGTDSMMRATSFLSDIPSEQHLNNHFMSTYVSQIKSKLKDPVEVEYKSNFKFTDWFN